METNKEKNNPIIILQKCTHRDLSPVSAASLKLYKVSAVQSPTSPFQFTFSTLMVLVVAGSCFQGKGSKSPLHRQQTDTVSKLPVNIMEHIAAKGPDISLRSWVRPKQRPKHRAAINFTFRRWPEN